MTRAYTPHLFLSAVHCALCSWTLKHPSGGLSDLHDLAVTGICFRISHDGGQPGFGGTGGVTPLLQFHGLAAYGFHAAWDARHSLLYLFTTSLRHFYWQKDVSCCAT